MLDGVYVRLKPQFSSEMSIENDELWMGDRCRLDALVETRRQSGIAVFEAQAHDLSVSRPQRSFEEGEVGLPELHFLGRRADAVALTRVKHQVEGR